MRPFVDVFLIVPAGNAEWFPATLCSALTQTYPAIRVVLFLQQSNDEIENLLNTWWYVNDVGYQRNRINFHGKSLTSETSQRGVIIRNTNLEVFGLQWLFEWQDKSSYVKILESGDILVPECIEYMMEAMKPEVDGVFSPLVGMMNSCFQSIRENMMLKGTLLKQKTMEKMVSEGFMWSDEINFANYCEKNGYKFAKTGPQDFLYICNL